MVTLNETLLARQYFETRLDRNLIPASTPREGWLSSACQIMAYNQFRELRPNSSEGSIIAMISIKEIYPFRPNK